MKNKNRSMHNIFRIITAFLISVLMCLFMCACGDTSNTEETVEITTPSEETTTADKPDLSIGTQDEDDGDDEDSDDDEDEDEDSGKYADTEYAKIYKDCNKEMKSATEKYVDELNDKASSLSKSKLYDETQARIDDLKEVYDKGKDKMVKTMLASTEDDEKAYKKYFNKMTEAYTEYTREITSAYTDAF